MSDAPAYDVEGVNLEAFERMIYTRDGSKESYERLIHELLGVLHKSRRGVGFFSAKEIDNYRHYTRLASAITALFADPNFQVSDEGFLALICQHTQLHAIFRASGFETMDHLLPTFGVRKEAHPEQMDFNGPFAVAKLLLCWSLESEVTIDFESLAKAAPQHCAAAITGMLSVGGSFGELAYQRRVMLMGLRHLIDAVPLPDILLQSAGDCYMHCSYTDAPDKHEIKRVINRKMRESIAVLHFEEVSREMVRKTTPTVVVPLEWFGSHHAMYRCYQQILRQLKRSFRLVAVCRKSPEQPSLDDISRQVFDKVVEIPDHEASIDGFYRAIRAEEPDILYYPSVGMAAWFVALSTYRLAPIQVMTPGHPASSMSPMMDYILSEGDLFGDERNYVEKCVHLPVGSVRYLEMQAHDRPAERMTHDGKVRIAIAAAAMKVIPPFLRTLKKIEERAGVPVEFHFFPNMTGLSNTLCVKDLQRWFPNAVIYPRAQYQQYLQWLGQADFVCETFPFGGTNSVIDCFSLGLPIVTREGDQILERSDASMIRRVGLPEWLIAHDEEEYVRVALRLIENGGREIGPLRRTLLNADLNAVFFGEPPKEYTNSFVEAFEKIYEEALSDRQATRAA